MENDLKRIENCFELAGGSSYRGYKLPEVDCMEAIRDQVNNLSCENEFLYIRIRKIIFLSETVLLPWDNFENKKNACYFYYHLLQELVLCIIIINLALGN